MYKNDRFIKEYFPKSKEFAHLDRSPILIDDYVGDALIESEGFSKGKAKAVADALNYIGLNGYTSITAGFAWRALKCIVGHGMSVARITDLYTKYIGDWGGESRNYRFDAIKDGEVVRSVTKSPMNRMRLEVKPSANVLREGVSYDVALVSVKALDENGNVLPYANEPISIKVEGPALIIGPEMTALRGGMGGFYLKSVGKKGRARVTVSSPSVEDVIFEIDVR
jgi:beta-galactosidase